MIVLLKVWQWRYKVYALLFCIFVLTSAPASLLTLLVKSAAPNLLLGEAHGSFWQGEVAQAAVKINGGSLYLGKLQWSIQPLSLLLLSPRVSIKTETAGQTLMATAKAYPNGSVNLSDVRGEVPVSIIEPWVPVLISGQVFFDFDYIAIKENTIKKLQGAINLRDIIWRGGDVPMPLGNYQAELSSNAEAITVNISDQNARLGLEGLVNAMFSGEYQMELTASAREGLNPAVIKSVAWLGKKRGEGVVVIGRRGEWK
mgnify:CR=1 FL=1